MSSYRMKEIQRIDSSILKELNQVCAKESSFLPQDSGLKLIETAPPEVTADLDVIWWTLIYRRLGKDAVTISNKLYIVLYTQKNSQRTNHVQNPVQCTNKWRNTILNTQNIQRNINSNMFNWQYDMLLMYFFNSWSIKVTQVMSRIDLLLVIAFCIKLMIAFWGDDLYFHLINSKKSMITFMFSFSENPLI